MELTRDIIQRCVPSNMVVSPPRTVSFGLGEGARPAQRFSVSIPLGDIGFVITQTARGGVLIHEKWEEHNSVRCQVHFKIDSEEQLQEWIEEEIKQQS